MPSSMVYAVISARREPAFSPTVGDAVCGPSRTTRTNRGFVPPETMTPDGRRRCGGRPCAGPGRAPRRSGRDPLECAVHRAGGGQGCGAGGRPVRPGTGTTGRRAATIPGPPRSPLLPATGSPACRTGRAAVVSPLARGTTSPARTGPWPIGGPLPHRVVTRAGTPRHRPAHERRAGRSGPPSRRATSSGLSGQVVHGRRTTGQSAIAVLRAPERFGIVLPTGTEVSTRYG